MTPPPAPAKQRRGASLWLRWSWRDIRQHFVAVVAIALVMAIGTGVYAGLGSTSTWRRVSNDASFATLNMHDLRIALSPGTFTTQGTLDGWSPESPATAGIEGGDARPVPTPPTGAGNHRGCAAGAALIAC